MIATLKNTEEKKEEKGKESLGGRISTVHCLPEVMKAKEKD